MKLLLNINITSGNIGKQERNHILTLLQDYAIKYTESKSNITIVIQKIVLPEVDMNILFYCVLYPYFNITNILYSPLGGAGCDFTMRIV